MSEAENNGAAPAYQVLARKYRPQNFDDLIGHEAMVKDVDQRLRHEPYCPCLHFNWRARGGENHHSADLGARIELCWSRWCR